MTDFLEAIALEHSKSLKEGSIENEESNDQELIETLRLYRNIEKECEFTPQDIKEKAESLLLESNCNKQVKIDRAIIEVYL